MEQAPLRIRIRPSGPELSQIAHAAGWGTGGPVYHDMALHRGLAWVMAATVLSRLCLTLVSICWDFIR